MEKSEPEHVRQTPPPHAPPCIFSRRLELTPMHSLITYVWKGSRLGNLIWSSLRVVFASQGRTCLYPNSSSLQLFTGENSLAHSSQLTPKVLHKPKPWFLIQNQILICVPPSRGCCAHQQLTVVNGYHEVTTRLPRVVKATVTEGWAQESPSSALLSKLLQGQKIRNAGSHYPLCPEGAWLLWQCRWH